MICGSEHFLVGVAGPLSGQRVAHAPLLHCATARLSNLNVDWILEDDKATPETAMTVAHRFITKKVKAVIGHFNSACAEAVIPLYRDHRIPLLLPASSQTSLTVNGGAFRLCSTDQEQAELLVAAIAKFDLSSIDIAIDDSAYALRVLHALKETETGSQIRVVNITNLPRIGVNTRLVFATCANAIWADQFLKNSQWNGDVIYSDDAHIKEFAAQSRDRNGIKSFVIGSREDYGVLIERACELVAMARQSGTDSLCNWLAKSGFFSTMGNALNARWQIYYVHQHSFTPVEISLIGKK